MRVLMVVLLLAMAASGCISVQHEESYEEPPPDWGPAWGGMWAALFLMLFVAVVVVVFVVLLAGGAVAATVKAADASTPDGAEAESLSAGQGAGDGVAGVRVTPRDDLPEGEKDT